MRHMDGPWKDNIHSQSLATPLFHLSLSLSWSLEFLFYLEVIQESRVSLPFCPYSLPEWEEHPEAST